MADVDTVEILALYDTDKPAFILAAADLRERRAKAATPGPWRWADPGYGYGKDIKLGLLAGEGNLNQVVLFAAMSDAWPSKYDAEHIAAEANPEHALAAVRRWRGVVERHGPVPSLFPPSCWWCSEEAADLLVVWPCPDLAETADEARAYLVGGVPA